MNTAEMDWKNLGQVKALAHKLSKHGVGMSVVKYGERSNYNIIHTQNERKFQDRDGGFVVLARYRNGADV